MSLQVLLLQEMLSVISYLPGQLSGDYNENTALAISAFQANSSIEKTGVPNFFAVKLLLEQVLKYYSKLRKKQMKTRRRQRIRQKKGSSRSTLPPLMEEDETPKGPAGEGPGEGEVDKMGAEDDSSDGLEEDIFGNKRRAENEEEQEEEEEENLDAGSVEDSTGVDRTTTPRRPKGFHKRLTKDLISSTPYFGNLDIMSPQLAELVERSDALDVGSASDSSATAASPQKVPLHKEGADGQTFGLMDSSPVASSSSSSDDEEDNSNKKGGALKRIPQPATVIVTPINGDPKDTPVTVLVGDANEENKKKKKGSNYSSTSSSLSSSPEEVVNYLSAVSSPTHSAPPSPRVPPVTPPLHVLMELQNPHMQSPRVVPYPRNLSFEGSDSLNNSSSEPLGGSAPETRPRAASAADLHEQIRNLVAGGEEDEKPRTVVPRARSTSDGERISEMKRGVITTSASGELSHATRRELNDDTHHSTFFHKEEVKTEKDFHTQDRNQTNHNDVNGSAINENDNSSSDTNKSNNIIIVSPIENENNNDNNPVYDATSNSTDGSERGDRGNESASSMHRSYIPNLDESEEFDVTEKDHQLLPDLPDKSFDPTTSTAYQLLYLRLPKYAPRWVYFAELETSITLVVVCSNHPANGAKGDPAERQKLDGIRDKMRKLIKPYADYLITKELTHLPILKYVISL